MTTYQPNTGEFPIELRPLPGSERAPAPQARFTASVDPDSVIEATLLLRRGSAIDTAGPAAADPADLATVSGTATALGLRVVFGDLASRRVRVSGAARNMQLAFGVQLERVESRAPDGSLVEHRHRTGGLSVPAALDGIVVAVLGLDDRPQARAQFRPATSSAAATGYTPVELGEIYRFSPGTDGDGQVIAIIELGGGFRQSDLDQYFSGLGITTPSVTAVGVDGSTNQPGQDADGEVLLDIEVAGALAPKARQMVYFGPNSDAGFVDAVSDAVHATPTPVAISISWGQNEDDWTDQARKALDGVFADAVALGITVTAAAGDSGSSDGAPGRSHADFPASSPNVLACGGTTLHADASRASITSETVWNAGGSGGATGGGVSDVFAVPAWQAPAVAPNAPLRGRGVPDVAGNADPSTGYRVLVDGTAAVYGGTSAVAPLWAALIARLAQAAGRPFGLLAAELYRHAAAGQPAAGFRDVTAGDNGAYSAGPGWDACTGLGSPDGVALLELLRADAPPG